MNITNLEITQAAIDMFFCIVCIIMADKLMYADKDEYYRRTGKNRRRV